MTIASLDHGAPTTEETVSHLEARLSLPANPAPAQIEDDEEDFEEGWSRTSIPNIADLAEGDESLTFKLLRARLLEAIEGIADVADVEMRVERGVEKARYEIHVDLKGDGYMGDLTFYITLRSEEAERRHWLGQE